MSRGAQREQRPLGFTLIELLVVVMIIGILAFIGIPQYLKTVETSKAQDAQSMVNMIGQATRMYNLNNPGQWPPAGQLSGTHALVTGNYISQQDWGNLPYSYFSASDANNAAYCNRNGAKSPYNSWGYNVYVNGAITAFGTNTPAPIH
jgi:type II secretion system protein G